MDYFNKRLFIPTDLSPETGDLAVLKRTRNDNRNRRKKFCKSLKNHRDLDAQKSLIL
jgi:hypothetical protein